MVFIIDEGSVFKAPLNKVWELMQSEGKHNHPSEINPRMAMDGDHPVLTFDVKMPDGRQVTNKIKLTLMPPVGVSLDYLEGPFAGSKSVQYYVPKGNETGVTVIGDYNSPWMSGDQLKGAVLMSLETAFNEDQENLKKL